MVRGFNLFSLIPTVLPVEAAMGTFYNSGGGRFPSGSRSVRSNITGLIRVSSSVSNPSSYEGVYVSISLYINGTFIASVTSREGAFVSASITRDINISVGDEIRFNYYAYGVSSLDRGNIKIQYGFENGYSGNEFTTIGG